MNALAATSLLIVWRVGDLGLKKGRYETSRPAGILNNESRTVKWQSHAIRIEHNYNFFLRGWTRIFPGNRSEMEQLQTVDIQRASLKGTTEPLPEMPTDIYELHGFTYLL